MSGRHSSEQEIEKLTKQAEETLVLDHLPAIAKYGSTEQILRLWPIMLTDARRLTGRYIRSYEYVLRYALKHVDDSLPAEVERLLGCLTSLMQRQPTAFLTFLVESLSHWHTYVIASVKLRDYLLSLLFDAYLEDKPRVDSTKLRAAILNCRDSSFTICRIISGDLSMQKKTSLTIRNIDSLLSLLTQSRDSHISNEYDLLINKLGEVLNAKASTRLQGTLLFLLNTTQNPATTLANLADTFKLYLGEDVFLHLLRIYGSSVAVTEPFVDEIPIDSDYFDQKLAVIEASYLKSPLVTLDTIFTVLHEYCRQASTDTLLASFSLFWSRLYKLLLHTDTIHSTYTPVVGLLLTCLASIFASSLHREERIRTWEEILYQGLIARAFNDVDHLALLNASFRAIGPLPADHGKLWLCLAYMHFSVRTNLIRGYSWSAPTRVSISSFDSCSQLLYKLICSVDLQVFFRQTRHLLTHSSISCLVTSLCQSMRLDPSIAELLSLTDKDRSILCASSQTVSDLHSPRLQPPEMPKLDPDDLKGEQQYKQSLAKYNEVRAQVLAFEDTRRKHILGLLDSLEQRIWTYVTAWASFPSQFVASTLKQATALALELASAVDGLSSSSASALVKILVALLNYGLSLCIEKALNKCSSDTHEDTGPGGKFRYSFIPCYIHNPAFLIMAIILLIKRTGEQSNRQLYDHFLSILSSNDVQARIRQQNRLYMQIAFTNCLANNVLVGGESFQSLAYLSNVACYTLSSQSTVGHGSYFMLQAAMPLFHAFLDVEDKTVVTLSAKQLIFEYMNAVLVVTPEAVQQSMPRQFYRDFLEQLLKLLDYGESSRLGRTILKIFCENIPFSCVDSSIIQPLLKNMSHPTQRSNRHMAIDGLMALKFTTQDLQHRPSLINTPELCCQFFIARTEFPLDNFDRFIASHLHTPLLVEQPVGLLRAFLTYVLTTNCSLYVLGLFPKTLENLLGRLLQYEQRTIYLAYIILINKLVCSYTTVEDSPVDVGTPAAFLRRQLWTAISIVTQLLTANNITVFQCQQAVTVLGAPELLLAGSLSMLPSHSFPIACNITLNEHSSEKHRRIQKLREECLFVRCNTSAPEDLKVNPHLVVVPNYFSEDIVLDTLRASPYIFVHQDPAELSCLELLVRFALVVGFLDFDESCRRSCVDAISSIFMSYGVKYKNQICFIKSSTRNDYMASVVIPESAIYLAQSAVDYGTLLLKHGNFYKYLLHQESLIHYLDINGISSIITVLTDVCSWLPCSHSFRDQFFDFLTEALKLQDNTDSRVLYHAIVRNVSRAFPPDAPEALEYAIKVLIPRFGDTCIKHLDTYPGAPFALAGISAYYGLECLIGDQGVISTYLLPLFGPADHISTLGKASTTEVRQILVALALLEGLYIGFGQLFEPCLVLVLPYILKLSGSPNKTIAQRLDEIHEKLLGNLSPFGMQYILSTLLKALDASSDWNERYGALTLMYCICTFNSAVISHSLLKSIIFSMLPRVIPVVLDIIVSEVNAKVKEAAQKTMDIITLSVQSPDIRPYVSRILAAFTDPSLLRDILCDVSDIKFKTKLDGASLTLLVPLCRKAITMPTATIYSIGRNRMDGVHTKVLACECLALCCKISNTMDLKEHAALIKQSLKSTLIETRPEIRSAGAKSLAILATAIPADANGIVNELWSSIFLKSKVPYAEAHGLAEAISTVLVDLDRADELYQHLRLFYYFRCNWTFGKQSLEISDTMADHLCRQYQSANAVTFLLILQYMTKRIVERKDLDQEAEFIKLFFREAFSMIFISAMDNVQDASYFLDVRSQIARILATSFLGTDNSQIESILQTIKIFAFSEDHSTRALCASLTADIISDLGSETMSTILESQPDDKSKKAKALLNEAYYSLGERSEKTKIFIPDNAVKHAITRLGKSNFELLMSIIFVLRLDPVSEVRTQAMTTWKAIVQKPLEMTRECMPNINKLLFEMSNCIDPTEVVEPDVFSYPLIVDLTIQDLVRMSKTYASEYFYPMLVAIVLDADMSSSDMDTDVSSALYILSVLLKHLPPPADTVSEQLIGKVSLCLSSSNVLISYSAANLFSSFGAGGEASIDVTSIVVDPLLTDVLESSSSADKSIVTLVSLCHKKRATMVTVIDRLLTILEEDLLGTCEKNQRVARFMEECLTGLPRPFYSAVKDIFQRVSRSLSSLSEEALSDTDLLVNFKTHPVGCILKAIVLCIGDDKDSLLMLERYCRDNFESPFFGQLVCAFYVLQLLLDPSSSDDLYVSIINDSDYIKAILRAVCLAMSRRGLAGSILATMNVLHSLTKSAGASNYDFLTAFAYGLYMGLRSALALNSGHLVVATQVDLSPLLDILMSLLSNKLTTNESVQNAVFTSSLFLLHTAGSVPHGQKSSPGVATVIIDEVPIFVNTEEATKPLKPYVTRLVGRTLNILNDQLPLDIRSKLLDMLSTILALSPANCRIFEGSIRITIMTKKGLTSAAKDVRTAAARVIRTLTKITTKPEQLAYILLSLAVSYSSATHQVAISSESVDINVSVLSCLADLLQTVTLNQSAPLSKIATLPLTQSILDSIISYIYRCYVFDAIPAYKGPAAECVASAVLQLPADKAIECIMNYVFEKSPDNLITAEQNRIALKLITATPVKLSAETAQPSGIELLLLAHEAYNRLNGISELIDCWLKQRIDKASESHDHLVLLELYAEVFHVAGSFVSTAGTSSPLCAKITELIAPSINCLETVLRVLVNPAQKGTTDHKLATIAILSRCVSSGELSEAHLKLLAIYIAVELKILLCDKSQPVMTAAEELFVSLFRLQYGMDFAMSIFTQLKESNEGFAKELQAYSEMLRKRLRAHS
ncbi:Translational activator GCN1 [Giardia duodenalis]|uniref:Translational activator GCN1 n=1 Tax=Giardia intestinalis (strain ATCC 50803 / WB clone C6) TaxID=184922 RepID=A8BGY3_GIAIC|nr:Translational activator GCN1 [Giardia intestinalis]KAE8301962.1 Translational activator GCN1 [Giardia intestinalis]|eukprot:XP_001707011.1 Translational activator GCN1 [Giardia lamblia ATCC 50803]